MKCKPHVLLLIVAMLGAGVCGGCDARCDMVDQPRYEPYEPSEFFADGQSARALLDGTVTRDGTVIGGVALDAAEQQRPEITQELLRRGRQRFDIYCSVCHGRDGFGEGMVVQSGYPAPPSLHSDRLRQAPDRHLLRVITQGLGKMPPYGSMVSPKDSWAIIAYVRALQLSQNARLDDAPEDQRRELLRRAERGGVDD